MDKMKLGMYLNQLTLIPGWKLEPNQVEALKDTKLGLNVNEIKGSGNQNQKNMST